MYYLVYGLLYLISLLPFRILYIISDAFYGLVYYVIGYRKKVVMNNLRIAFPVKTEKERIQIAKRFYHNLVDYFVESIKLISISDKEFNKRCSGNFDEMNRIATSGTNIQIHSGHQFNWEFANKILSQKISVRFVLVYMPISSKIIDKLFKKIRSRNGTVLANAANYKKDMLGVYKQNHVLALVVDQNPANVRAAYWLNFFSKPAPFIYTLEKNAVRNNYAVAFLSIDKIKRGYYKFKANIITTDAVNTQKGELTKKYRDFLENQIKEQPANYLWSHRRWKHEYKKEYKKLWID